MVRQKKSNLHTNNKHKFGYDFESLCQSYPELKPYVFKNAFDHKTIDFSDPKAVKVLNAALLKAHYGIDFWEFPDAHLCPPIPGRVDYLHYLNDVLIGSNLLNTITVLDIGTGATCIYPLLGHAEFGWTFIASDIDKESLKTAQNIVDQNQLSGAIALRLQPDKAQILKGVLNASETITACICNPPFFKSEAEALAATTRKLQGLGKQADKVVRNFSGTASELWYKGGEKAFLHNYLYESSLFKTNCFWFTSLVSNKDLVKSMQNSLKKLGATEIKIIPMSQGNKMSRLVLWTFLNTDEQKLWTKAK